MTPPSGGTFEGCDGVVKAVALSAKVGKNSVDAHMVRIVTDVNSIITHLACFGRVL